MSSSPLEDFVFIGQTGLGRKRWMQGEVDGACTDFDTVHHNDHKVTWSLLGIALPDEH